MDFLARYPRRSDENARRDHRQRQVHPAIDGVIKRADAVETRASPAYEAALAKRDSRDRRRPQHGARLTALAFPTLRRKPAVIGQAQGGSNCQMSATTGFPAMSIPAGFTEDGLPVGNGIARRPFSENRLLRVAYAYERLARPRKPPKSTP